MALDADVLNVGCGLSSRPGMVNLDMADLPGVDVVHNLDVFPWPFADRQFGEVRAIQVFEHVDDPVGFMREAHRVLKDWGRLYMAVPHYQSNNSFTDPTHKRHCTERTFDYWCEGTSLHKQFGASYAGDAVFEKVRVERVKDDIQVDLRKI